MRWRVRPRDLNHLNRQLNVFTDGLHRILDNYHWDNMKQIYYVTYATTMVATGETRSVLFRRRKQFGVGTSHIVGYGPTSNNQSFMQEFDEGKVHRREKQHLHKLAGFGRETERAKCSRVPEDLWIHTRTYHGNPRARRKALALSIEEQLGTRVRFAVKSGGDLYYKPNLQGYTRRLGAITDGVVKKVFA